ncbi:MAG: HAMP domain-containing protein [Chloroflexi bacterium]|jgi:energy-coupling factor transport system substrate-specific component|nr:HAMP domain-containing protein [Chloroflexota bacterium]
MTIRPAATWRVGRRELYAMLGGTLLYAALSWMTNIFQLQAADNLQIRPGVGVPILFGFVFGPIVGFVTGFAGNFITDLSSGLLPYPPVVPLYGQPLDTLRAYLVNWQIGNGIMGLIPGLAALHYRQYFSLRDQLRALAIAAVGIVAGMAFASFTHPLVEPAVTTQIAYQQYFRPLVWVNLVNAAILVPIVLFNYERIDTRASEWLRSGLMRRISLAILVSAALPVALLGLFLTQQTTGTGTNSFELTGKLIFTIALTMVFTITNAGLVAQSMVRPLLRLTGAAREMATGQLDTREAAELENSPGSGEINHLTRVFGRMAREVIQREETLKQQVKQLRIEIDETKKSRQVAEITETDYFQNLRQKAQSMRSKD